MADNNKDIVDLVIRAENLTSEELKEAAGDLEKLGSEAREASRELDQLEINKSTLDSYRQLGNEVDRLTDEIVESQTTYKRLKDELKKTKDATDEQRAAVVRQNETTKKLRKELTSTQTQYNNLAKKLRNVGLETKDFGKAEEELNKQIVKTKANIKSANDQLDRRSNKLRESIELEERNVKQLAEEAIAAEKTRVAKEKLAKAAAEELAAKRRETEETSRVTIAIRKYEQELSKLNAEKQKGSLSSGDYIKSEERLRRELRLTEKQISTSRKAIEADADAKNAAVRSTDALTKVTRRLAQAYTVLVAAQSAAAAVGGAVKGYGELEAAITKVEKTTGNARQEVEAIAEQLSIMAKDVTPTATTELLRYAEVAGQLGTKSTADILNLVSAADTLQVSTNLAGDEASLLLARILGMTNQGIPAIQNLSSTVVDLGNNMKVAEDEIVRMTKEIVSGTREIGLSAQASAALGATLAETGQQAERSRTAFFRLSNSIRQAVSQGGDELSSLIEITGQTADELERNLGERSEVIITDFVKGLARIRSEGQTLTGVLKNFGIEGTEAGAVFSALTDNVDVLEAAFKRADQAFVDGTRHIEEAAKAYSDQDAAVARLINKFQGLQKAVGEAFADETDAAIRETSRLIDEMGEEVVDVMEYIPQLISGFQELLETVDNMFNALGVEANLLTQSFDTIKLAINAVTISLNTLTYGLQSAVLETMELYNTFSLFEGIKIPTEQIENLKARMAETRASIERDAGDIDDAMARLAGNSSDSFEDLRDVVAKYGEAVGELSEQQQKQIKEILEVTGYQKEQEELYRDLVAAIVRQNRELEIERELKARAAEQAERDAEAKAKEAAATEKSTAATEKSNQAVEKNIQLTEAQKIAIQEQLDLKQAGLITEEQYANYVEAVTGGLTRQVSAIDLITEGKTKDVEITKSLIEQSNQLYAQFSAGEITVEQLAEAQGRLLQSYGDTTAANVVASEAVGTYSIRQQELRAQIQASEKTLDDYNRQLQDSTKSEREKAEILTKQAIEQDKLNKLREKSNELGEIENATYGQLRRLYQNYSQELERVNDQFRTGALTKAEYTAETNRLNGLISELSQVLNINTNELDKNTEAIKRNKAEKQDQKKESQEVTQAVSLELEAFKYLSKEFDFTSQSTEELTKRYNELQASINRNNKVSSLWLKNLADISNQGFRREQQIIEETKAMRQWEKQVNSGTLSMSQLAKMADAANWYFDNLNEQQLSGLRGAIADARREFQALNEAIDDSLQSVEDRLDRARGNEEAIVKRQFERELQELLDLQERARSAGDQATLNKINEAIRKLREAQKLEFKEQFGQQAQQARQETREARTAATQTLGTYDVNVTTERGSATIKTADRQSAENLLDIIQQLGEGNIEGNV